MKILGLLVAAFSLVVGVAAAFSQQYSLFLLAGFGLVASVTTMRAATISGYLKIFIAIFSTETILFGAAALLDALDLWPALLDDFKMPLSVAVTVALFSILVYAVSHLPLVRRMSDIADLYFASPSMTTARIWPFPAFRARERTLAIMMVAFLVVINQLQVLFSILISFVSRDLFNAIQNYDAPAFWHALLIAFPILAFPYIASLIIEFVVSSTLVIRWRQWLTDYYVGRWLNGHTHYRMGLLGATSDNPDQRIAEDIYRFIDGGGTGYGIYTFTILLISTLSSLVSFSILLWTLSSTFTIPGTMIVIPGFLFWCALIYASIGTVLIHLIGAPLSALSFTRQRFEADFRFSLARLREYGEQVALLSGEASEKAVIGGRFGAIVKNYYDIVACRKKMMTFSSSYNQISPFIPYLVAAPFYFAHKITLGIMQQTARAFSEVNSSLTFFVTYYVQLAEYKSVLDRLSLFDQALQQVETRPTTMQTVMAESDSALILKDVSVRLPDGSNLLANVNLQLRQGQDVLLMGPSGSGKSTLFRVVSGIWPYCEGDMNIPAGASFMLLPQKPYMPIGTLRTAVTYPATSDVYDEPTIIAALKAVELGSFADKLDIEDNWSQRLSGGEQQRLAVARAILAKPRWLFLDEATSAMDEPIEERIYASIATHLPDTTIVSIGHRSSLVRLHDRQIEMRKTDAGDFAPVDRLVQAAE
jgi:putative ATP-binding cassette transporter